MKKAFTLFELMIVVAILGILAAIALPEFQSHTRQAREAAARDVLRILRNQIELYAAQHNGTPPGFPNGDTTASPTYLHFFSQITRATNKNGDIAIPGTPGYPLGPYLPEMPENPLNNKCTVKILLFNEDFPTTLATDASGEVGWIYKPATKKIRINCIGTDSKDTPFSEY